MSLLVITETELLVQWLSNEITMAYGYLFIKIIIYFIKYQKMNYIEFKEQLLMYMQ